MTDTENKADNQKEHTIMTVLQILNRLKELEPTSKIRMFDTFGQMFTPASHVDSWRGSYDQPAVVVKPINRIVECTSVGDFTEQLKECDGKDVIGYKGGNFTLSQLSTLFLVSEWEVSGDNTTIREILDDGYCILEPDSY